MTPTIYDADDPAITPDGEQATLGTPALPTHPSTRGFRHADDASAQPRSPSPSDPHLVMDRGERTAMFRFLIRDRAGQFAASSTQYSRTRASI